MDNINPYRKEQGFTLTEILIAVAVMALLLAVAIPNSRSRIQAHRVDRIVTEIQSLLQRARSQAMTQGRPLTVTFQDKGREFTYSSDLDGDGLYTGTDELQRFEIPQLKGVKIKHPKRAGAFDPRGTFECDDKYWVISISSKNLPKKYLYVLPGGQVEKSDKSI